MFGLFGKSGFNSEIEKLENDHKILGAQLMSSMQMINIQEQMRIINAMLNLYDKRIECCKKYSKFVFKPLKLKSKPGILVFGKTNARGFPFSAMRSMCGPPG